MESLFKSLSVGNERIFDSIVYAQNEVVGIVRPAVIEGCKGTESAYIAGPEGIIELPLPATQEAVFEALVLSRSILFGDEEQVFAARELLRNEKTSRTASYFCCVSRNCQELISAFERIKNARTLIVGCGGIGSLVAMQLAGAGIEDLVLVDPDIIEASNLNRQFLWEINDIGRPKVEVLKNALECRYSLRSCRALVQKVSDSQLDELTRDVDLVVLSADEPLGVAQVKLQELSRERNFLTISCGYYQSTALVKVFGKSEAQADDDSCTIEWARTPNFIGPSFGPINVEVAGVVASSAIHAIGFPESIYWREKNSGLSLSWIPFSRREAFLS
ncbi:hypothetical protein PS862_02077 [Pseudomonas fluorescens]|uniref:THIF-type NAD/FAD binding fold domain-containing protein n=1 Tax=Pseudomonas fluorescens TaxID=294 RepID=A0A5E7J958_PSEFL|nr:ThiF family adenylyltransferase [Pseudomonas fluorescens]VVO85779.1 hypothetical protein PS862_02077 [Pseudomonas fluorescens]